MKIKLRSPLFSTRFASKRVGYATLLAAATLVFAIISLTLWRPASLAAMSNRQQSCPHCAAKSNQIIYLPLIDLPEAQGSELVFNSRSPQEMEVTPTFYKLDGTAIVGKPVNVQSAEIRYVDLKKLIPGQYRNDTDWGGMSLAYYGVSREMWAQFRLLGINGGGSVDEFFTVPSEVRSDLQESVWWTPPNSTAILALGNITDTETSATVRFGDGQQQAVKLAPHATEIIRHVSRSQTSSESVAISITGAPGSVIPTGVIAAADGSFNSVIRFYETKLAKQPDLFGNGLRLAGITPHLVLKNTSSAPVKAMPRFIPLAGSAAGMVELPAVAVKANETVEVDLSALLNTAQSRHDLDTVSVAVSDSGASGSLIGALYSSNKTTGINYEVPLRDSGPPRSMTGAYPWKISDDYTTIVYLTNISNLPTEFVAQINYDGGKYVLGIQKLAAGETAAFDMKQMIAEQKPDAGNRQLPKDLQSGQFKWLVHGVTGGKVILIGRAEMVSRAQHISTSYSCAENCIASYTGGIDPASMVAMVGSTHAMSAWEEAQYASGSTLGPYGASGTWSNTNTSIATITSGGSCTAVAGGQATIQFTSGFVEVYSWDGLNCVDIGPTQWDADSGVQVDEEITISQVLFTSPSPLQIKRSGGTVTLRVTLSPSAHVPTDTVVTISASQLINDGGDAVNITGQNENGGGTTSDGSFTAKVTGGVAKNCDYSITTPTGNTGFGFLSYKARFTQTTITYTNQQSQTVTIRLNPQANSQPTNVNGSNKLCLGTLSGTAPNQTCGSPDP